MMDFHEIIIMGGEAENALIFQFALIFLQQVQLILPYVDISKGLRPDNGIFKGVF